MKKFDTQHIIGNIKAPFTRKTHEHYNQAIQETGYWLGKALVNGSYSDINLVVLDGCEVTYNPGGNSSLTAGVILYQRELFQVSQQNSIPTSVGQTLVWEKVTEYTGGNEI